VRHERNLQGPVHTPSFHQAVRVVHQQPLGSVAGEAAPTWRACARCPSWRPLGPRRTGGPIINRCSLRPPRGSGRGAGVAGRGSRAVQQTRSSRRAGFRPENCIFGRPACHRATRGLDWRAAEAERAGFARYRIGGTIHPVAEAVVIGRAFVPIGVGAPLDRSLRNAFSD